MTAQRNFYLGNSPLSHWKRGILRTTTTTTLNNFGKKSQEISLAGLEHNRAVALCQFKWRQQHLAGFRRGGRNNKCPPNGIFALCCFCCSRYWMVLEKILERNWNWNPSDEIRITTPNHSGNSCKIKAYFPDWSIRALMHATRVSSSLFFSCSRKLRSTSAPKIPWMIPISFSFVIILE